ncbi:MAG: hypothetical protein LAT81_08995 [Oceanicaulis sp.]|nr:hypothetical protein [Oceanicaulis sp.]
MSFLIDLLHLLVAALLAVIGIGYECDSEDCPPIRFEPAAHGAAQPEAARPLVSLTYDTAASGAVWSEAARDCEPSRAAVTLPAL